MTTVIRRRRASRTQLGPYRRNELLTGRIQYPVQGYTGYGDGVGTDLTAFITDGMRADWAANREELLAFWRSGKTEADVFPDTLPWLYAGSRADTLCSTLLVRRPYLRHSTFLRKPSRDYAVWWEA